jgi:hypothetical protein
MSRTSRTEWAKRVERWAESGLTAKEFAAETGLKASTLSFWKWRLGSEQRARSAAPEMTSAKRGRRGTAQRALPSVPTFVEMTPASTAVSRPLELVLRDELTLRVPVGFDEETLSRVLRLVGAAR